MISIMALLKEVEEKARKDFYKQKQFSFYLKKEVKQMHELFLNYASFHGIVGLGKSNFFQKHAGEITKANATTLADGVELVRYNLEHIKSGTFTEEKQRQYQERLVAHNVSDVKKIIDASRGLYKTEVEQPKVPHNTPRECSGKEVGNENISVCNNSFNSTGSTTLDSTRATSTDMGIDMSTDKNMKETETPGKQVIQKALLLQAYEKSVRAANNHELYKSCKNPHLNHNNLVQV